MIALVWAVLLVGNVPVPTPSPSALKTIVTVHSSVFCQALHQGVAPVLRGLMRDDTLIALGRSAYASMNHEATYGGYLESSYNQQGAAQVVVSSGLLGFLEYRQRQIATALEHNVETIEAMLNDTKRFPDGLPVAEQSALFTTKSQLASVVRDQRIVINVLSGATDAEQLIDLFNKGTALAPSTGSASLNGAGPLQAQEEKYDPSLRLQALAYPGYVSFGNSTYAKLAQVIAVGQKQISDSETVVAETVIANAPACAPTK
jgi:hypothetical protein